MHIKAIKLTNKKTSVFEFAKKALREHDRKIDEATIEKWYS